MSKYINKDRLGISNYKWKNLDWPEPYDLNLFDMWGYNENVAKMYT